MKIAFLITAIGALALGIQAGDWGKAPIDKTPIQECVDLGGTIAMGYHTDFFVRGTRFSGDTVTAGVSYNFDELAVPVLLSANYINGITDNRGSSSFDLLALSARADLGTFAGFQAGLAYTQYVFPEIRSNIMNQMYGFGELGFDLRRSLGFADLVFDTNYAMGGLFNGWYHHLGLERSFSLTDDVSLVLGAGVAYSDNYFHRFKAQDSGWNHYYLTLALPVKLNCRTTLTPYIGFTGAPNTWITDGINPSGLNPQTDILHGGVTLSVSF